MKLVSLYAPELTDKSVKVPTKDDFELQRDHELHKDLEEGEEQAKIESPRKSKEPEVSNSVGGDGVVMMIGLQ